MGYKIKDIIAAMNQLAPESLAMEWDRVGLQVGSPENEVKKVFLALDLTEHSLTESLVHQPELIITHHPFIFSPLTEIRTDREPGNLIQQLLTLNIGLYAAHTNMDIARGGLNDWVSHKLGLTNVEILEQTSSNTLLKLVVYVPDKDVDAVAEALATTGAGHIGKYSHCSFRLQGVGSFKPLEGAKPAIGQINQMQQVSETRIETILPLEKLAQTIESMKKAHPYEEVAYDVYQLYQPGKPEGIGRTGILPTPVSVEVFMEQLKMTFNLKMLKYVGASKPNIGKVGVLTGSGASAIKEAVDQGCDALVTGDVKYHDAQLAETLDIHLFDVGHFESESCFTEIVNKHLQAFAKNNNDPLTIIESKQQKSPFKIV